jgi:hypothetical protein
MTRLIFSILFITSCFDTIFVAAQPPKNFQRDNLVAWCIVPFDACQRSPQARAKMLRELGLRRCAYDWRAQNVALFEDEIFQYRKHGIEYVAFWDEHETAFELFKKHELAPQVWKTLSPHPPGDTRDEKVAAAVSSVLPLATKTKQLGFRLGLYNHGGWGGEPENLVAVCQALRRQDFSHVGIVYNFHHGHGHIKDFEAVLRLMKPYLFCLNLNGMVDLEDAKYKSNPGKFKILPIGRGDFERQMIQTVIRTRYEGAIGVLGHVADCDVAEVLKQNIEGLERILGQ